jgi:hypothetical protein
MKGHPSVSCERRPSHLVVAIRIGAAAVWLLFGLLFKVAGVMPHHRLIAGCATILVGLGEAALGLWVLTGAFPRICALAQSLAIVSMNAFEFILARHLLLAPVPMACANVAFIALIWYAALETRRPTGG